MSNYRSSSTSVSKKDYEHPLLGDRRPSWTPTTEHDDLRVGKSQSKRRPRKTEEVNARSPEWNSSLLLARRPSFAPSLDEAMHRARGSRARRVEDDVESSPESTNAVPIGPGLPESPEEGKGLKSSWEINVKDLVGDAVGNMSISPTSRDIVLAARRGLFIIDLESPFSIPRFLPQGGTWDVADVQWNPHPSHAQYIVSTSSEKMLIWNLRFGGKTSIEHILKSHYRAITDINWHTTECDIVVSTGIDSWVWAWDIRTPRKPIFGLCAFNAGGTHVKWNRHNPNLLASSHADEVLIWDRRKGSLPVTKIAAHASLIYGIDWSRHSRDEITTCSLDKTIKTWDINAASSATNPQPKHVIRTNYPVWRARHLPFGEGILSLPQRGETTLELYAKSEKQTLVETFEGHSDVVKEFVWRKGPQDDYQLVTWSKDRTLRFWPVDPNVMERVGHKPQLNRGRSKLTRSEQENETFTTFTLSPGESNDYFNDYFANAFSAPFSENRSRPLPQPLQINRHYGPFGQSTPSMSDTERTDTTPTLTSSKPISIDASGFASAISRSVAAGGISMSRSMTGQGETMSKAGTGSRSVAKVDQLAWLASFRVGGKRGYSSGTSNSEGGGSNGGGAKDGNGGSAQGSRLSLKSRLEKDKGDRSPSKNDLSRQSSGSLSRASEDRVKDNMNENNQSLHDEITSVLTKLANSKIKLEKLDLSSKKRTCTLGLHGPWGDTSSVFMRVTFIFPRDYPQEAHPYGTPSVELERNPLISLHDRAYINKHLRRIREKQRPCLEACLRFLLFADEKRDDDDDDDDLVDTDEEDETSDEDSAMPTGGLKKKKKRDITISLFRTSKNLTEPRTSQGAFGPNGELICFFRAAPRMVRHNIRGVSEDGNTKGDDSLSVHDGAPQPAPQHQQLKTSYFQSPALVADAVRRLGLAALDRTVQPIDPRHPEAGMTILKAMTNLLTVSQPQHQRVRRDRETGGDPTQSYSYVPLQRSTVFLLSTRSIAGADQRAARDYVFSVDGGSLAEVCERNADAAKSHGRFDHERVFRSLKTLFRQPQNEGDKWRPLGFSSDHLAKEVITRLYDDAAKEKDVQLLAMISMLVLQTEHRRVLPRNVVREREQTPAASATPRSAGFDYFSLSKPTANPISPIQFAWSRMPTPPNQRQAHAPPSISSSNSSRGSWSSLFNTGTMRQFMNGVQDSLKEGLLTPSETLSTTTPDIHVTGTLPPNQSPVGRGSSDRNSRTPESPGGSNGNKRRLRKNSSLVISPPGINLSKSWGGEGGQQQQPTRKPTISFSSTNESKRPSLRFVDMRMNVFVQEKRVVFEPPPVEEPTAPLFDLELLEQFQMNVYHYTELLFRWQMYHKRLELLNAVNDTSDASPPRDGIREPHKLGLHRLCMRPDCKNILPDKANVCQYCNTPCPMPACTVCRLPVKGLARTCVLCAHVTHISCWNSLEVTVPICPSGCGCFCSPSDLPFTRPSTRLGLTPPVSTLLLPTEL